MTPTEPHARHPGDGWQIADPYPMRRSTLRAFRGVVHGLLPLHPAVPDLSERVILSVRQLMQYMHPVMAYGFCVVLHLLDWAPLWRFRSWRRLRSLPPERASLVLQGLGESRLSAFRMLVMGARGAVLSTWFDQSEVHAVLDYDPTPYLRSRVAVRARLLAGSRPAAEDMLGNRAERIAP